MCNMAQLTTKTTTTTPACVCFLCDARATPVFTGNCALRGARAAPELTASPRSSATVSASIVVVARPAPAAPHLQPPRPVGLLCLPNLMWGSALCLTTNHPAKHLSAKRLSAMVAAAVPELAAVGHLHQQHHMWWCWRLRLSLPAVPAVPELAALGHLHRQHRMWWCLRLRLSLPAVTAVPETAASLDLPDGLCLQLPRPVSHPRP